VNIATPAAGETFANGQVADTSFSCSQASPGPGVSSCTDQTGRASGSAIDTSHAGTYTLTVTARSPDGVQGTASVTYTVLPPAPVGSTGQAWGITQTVALLDGTVDPEGAVVSSCRFEYGVSSVYGSTAACAFSPGEGSAPVAVSAALSHLRSGTQYHYRLVVTGPGGTTNGGDGVFTTATAPCLARVGHVRISGATVRVPLAASGSSGMRCTVHATLRTLHGRHLVANKTVMVRTGSKRTIRLSLSRAGRKLLRSSHELKVSLEVRQTTPRKQHTLATKPLTLR
jgi:hypothetical protein